MTGASEAKIRVLIAEDQQLIRRAFAAMLSLETDIEVVGEACDGREAARLAALTRPDVVLMDLNMPRLGGVAATREIMGAGSAGRIIVLTTFDDEKSVFDAIAAGASAYLLKDADEAEILATIRGQSRLSPSVADKLMREFRRTHGEAREGDEAPSEPLTDREREILGLVAAGRSNKEIARALRLAEGTVKNYVSRIMEKVNARSRTELAVKAVRGGA